MKKRWLHFATTVLLSLGAISSSTTHAEEPLFTDPIDTRIMPIVSLDGEWIYFTRIYNLKDANQWSPPREGLTFSKST